MDLSIEELAVTLRVIESRFREVSTCFKRLERDSEKRSRMEKELEILGNIRGKLSEMGRCVAIEHGDITRDGAASAANGSQQNFSNRHMLLVDDNESVRKHMIHILKRHGFKQFDEAEDGHEAIAKIKSVPYDLILCDMNMPTISGLDVLRLMRKDSSCAKTPFIMVTSEGNKALLLEAIKAGVSDFVAKPVDEDNLLKKITSLL